MRENVYKTDITSKIPPVIKSKRMSKKNILIISFEFPPTNSVGAIRAAAFCRHLPKYGWSLSVLTANTKSTEQPDSGRFSEVFTQIENIYTVDKTTPFGITDSYHVKWGFDITREIIRIVRQQNIDVIFHTAGPFLPLISCPVVKNRTKVKYIIDMRDVWSVKSQYIKNITTKTRAKLYLAKQIERRAFNSADGVVFTTEKMREEYIKEYPWLNMKSTVITNGFESTEFERYDSEESDLFRLVLAGKFTYQGDVDPSPFLIALEKFYEDVNDVELLHFGNRDMFLEKALANYSLEDVYHYKGYADLETLIPAIKGANLAIATGRSETETATKLYEYMACDTPILYLGKVNGAAARMIREFKYSSVTTTSDVREIYKILKRVYTERPNELGARNIERYHRERLAEDLSEYLNKITN